MAILSTEFIPNYAFLKAWSLKAIDGNLEVFVFLQNILWT